LPTYGGDELCAAWAREESDLHVLRDFLFAKMVWEASGMDEKVWVRQYY